MHWATVVHILWQLLGWPAGIILGNLLASVIWAGLAEWRLTVHGRRTDKNVNKKISDHQDDMKQILSDHHDSIKEMINSGQQESKPVSV